MNEQDLRYALAKQVPDMARGFTVSTGYGAITIPEGKLAKHLQAHMERALVRELGVQAAAAIKANHVCGFASNAINHGEIFNTIFGGRKQKRRKAVAPTAPAKEATQ